MVNKEDLQSTEKGNDKPLTEVERLDSLSVKESRLPLEKPDVYNGTCEGCGMGFIRCTFQLCPDCNSHIIPDEDQELQISNIIRMNLTEDHFITIWKALLEYGDKYPVYRDDIIEMVTKTLDEDLYLRKRHSEDPQLRQMFEEFQVLRKIVEMNKRRDRN